MKNNLAIDRERSNLDNEFSDIINLLCCRIQSCNNKV